MSASRSVASFRGWERRRENEERVTVNIEPHLLPLWRRVKATIKGLTPHARFEHFQEYAQTDEGQRAALEALIADCPFALPEEATETDTAAELVASGAIQVAPGVWSLDPRAVFALAYYAGDRSALAFAFPGRVDDGEACEVTIDASAILDAAEDAPPDSWTVDLTPDGLAIVSTLGGGLRLCGGNADVRAVVPLPADLPQACDSAAE